MAQPSPIPATNKRQGYDWITWGENVYAYADSVFYGHAGFAVDWGGPASAGGMQDPPGHRNNMWNRISERWAWVSWTESMVPSVRSSLPRISPLNRATSLITGVVYYDFNSNGFYDLGEGIGGVTVSSPGSAYYSRRHT